jgi:hypothetical protein
MMTVYNGKYSKGLVVELCKKLQGGDLDLSSSLNA